MVAKLYQKYPHGDPYLKGNKTYVKIQKPDGTEKEVRWYNDAEYRRMYPGEVPEKEQDKLVKKRFGFEEKGYITVPTGEVQNFTSWLQVSNARWSGYFGWYFVSNEEIPKDYPRGLGKAKIKWEDVTSDGVELKPQKDTMAVVAAAGGKPLVCQ